MPFPILSTPFSSIRGEHYCGLGVYHYHAFLGLRLIFMSFLYAHVLEISCHECLSFREKKMVKLLWR